MKELILLISILLFFCIETSISQVSEDTVYIKFNKKTDLVKRPSNGEKMVLWLKNHLYDKELSSYRQLLKKYESDTVQPPLFPTKPVKYYKYYTLRELERCSDSLIIELKSNTINYLSRNKLKQLTPYQKDIFIVKRKEKSYMCFEVSFYENVVE